MQGSISAKNKKEADTILESLLQKKLVAGGLITNGPSRFWWKEKIVNANYYNISVFTNVSNRQAIIDNVRKKSTEEAPMVWFTELDGNQELLGWIDTRLNT